MADPETKVEETTKQDATVKTNEEVVVDYDKELEEAAKATHNEIGYELRHKNKDVATEEEEDDKPLTKKDLDKVVSTFKQAAESNSLEVKLDKVAGSNESLKKLIKFHIDNSVNPSLSLDAKVEAAYAIANKKLVDKTVKEINIAQQNRSQISNVGQGTNSETHAKPGQNVLSDSQINKLKEQHKNWNLPGSVDDFIKKTIERMNS